MKIVLFALNSSFYNTNLAVRSLKNVLDRSGFSVVIKEFSLKDMRDSVLDSLYAEKADAYGFSCYIWNIDEMLSLANDLKKLLPECYTIFGGPEVSFDCERFEPSDFIDFIIRGEGEAPLLELCKGLREKSIKKSYTRPMILGDTDSVSIPHGDMLYTHDTPGVPDTSDASILYYESSRGCPFSCSFCLSSASSVVRAKSAKETLDDLQKFEGIKGKTVKFIDRTFNFDKRQAFQIWEGLLDSKYTKCYHFEICADLIDDETIQLLSRFPKGKIQLEIGLQSTCHKVLSSINRHRDTSKTLSVSKRIAELGNIHVHLDLIAGLPYDTYESFALSFNEAFYCCHKLQLGFLKLLHGTSLRRSSAELGIVYSDKPPYKVLYTPDISFEELIRLEEISFILERFGESGNFERSLKFALSVSDTPFSFFEGFNDFIKSTDGRHIRKISQPDAFGLLWSYISPRLSPDDSESFSAAIHDDYTSNEARKPPASVFKSRCPKA